VLELILRVEILNYQSRLGVGRQGTNCSDAFKKTASYKTKKEKKSMAHHLRKRMVLVSFLVQVLFILLCIGPIYAAQADLQKPTGISQAPSYKMENLQIMKQPTIKIQPKMMIKIPVNIADRKADLSCTINAYYDQNRMKQIQGHLWDMSTAYSYGLPYPWNVHWEIVVMNNGTAIAQNFVINLNFTNPIGSHQVFNETETLEPGEAAVLKYRFGPFGPGASYLYGKHVGLVTKTDSTAKIAESNEANNMCTDWVGFAP
jgi:hypothetical protein